MRIVASRFVYGVTCLFVWGEKGMKVFRAFRGIKVFKVIRVFKDIARLLVPQKLVY